MLCGEAEPCKSRITDVPEKIMRKALNRGEECLPILHGKSCEGLGHRVGVLCIPCEPLSFIILSLIFKKFHEKNRESSVIETKPD